ncbi:hypothetical protein ACOMHN_021506 [Nucella lapillus]
MSSDTERVLYTVHAGFLSVPRKHSKEMSSVRTKNTQLTDDFHCHNRSARDIGCLMDEADKRAFRHRPLTQASVELYFPGQSGDFIFISPTKNRVTAKLQVLATSWCNAT